MSIRQARETLEHEILSPYACHATDTRGRKEEEAPCPVRTVYQRDRDRILHSQSFRRLMNKTQAFLFPAGDHYRTRLTHTLEVDQIARTIASALRLNEDLTEAIALGHDVGHTPFGHTGEDVLSRLMPKGFRHREQSVRVLQALEKDGHGLNLTWEVEDGILHHSGDTLPTTLEGQIVRYADRIAYINHDIEDAIRAGVLTAEEIPWTARHTLGRTKSERISTLSNSLIANSTESIQMAPEVQKEFDALRKFMFDTVYTDPIVKSEQDKAMRVIEQLYHYFSEHSHAMPSQYRKIAEHQGTAQGVGDYISGMTDRYCIALYEDLFIPKPWGVS